jgi:hypothetical protein
MTQKKIFLKNINMGIQNTQNFMLISNSLMTALMTDMPLTKVNSKKPRKNAQKQNKKKIRIVFGL